MLFIVGKSRSHFFLFFAPQGRSAEIFIKISSFFSPAVQLGGNSGNNISTYSLDFYHQGRLVGILITISLLFLWIFCPAGPLGGIFYNDSVIFYLVFMSRRAAWRECRYQFHYVFFK